MNIPKQSAPIQRNIPTASISQGSGVEASDTIDDIFRVAQGVTGTLGSLVPLAPLLLGAGV